MMDWKKYKVKDRGKVIDKATDKEYLKN
jgi:hypothetical protein